MSTKRLLLLSALALSAILLALLIMLAPGGSAARNFELPSPAQSDPPAEDGFDARAVAITADNVREVVARIRRPDDYSRELRSEQFWDGGTAVYNFSVAVSGQKTSVVIRFGQTVKRIILRDGYVYVRYDGGYGWFSTPQLSPSDADEYQMLPTYESVTALGREDVLSAELRYDDAGRASVFVRAADGALGYVTEYTISAEYGLVTLAETYDGDTLVFRVSAGECDTERPDGALFEI
ncbi:MAG: hypothetical protein LBS90_08410 [Oscillospiraceae bacterium]|jgi:hypothetical protein|nr:hypothetical protein [Oscillospiraceae bacterium]